MDKKRLSEWIDNSQGIQHIELLILPEVQGLGVIDVRLLEELPKIKIGGEKTPEELAKLAEHIMLSKLWVIGTYESIRVIQKITKEKDILRTDTKQKIKELFTSFNRIRVPLAKFEKSGNGHEELYSGIADSFVDKEKGVGWKVYEHQNKKLNQIIFYRKDLANEFLNLLKLINEDIRAKYYPARH
jgi:hypothetical protein